MSDTFLQIERLEKNWDTVQVNVSFSVNRREMLAIVGQSGSGKSTILRMIAGLLKPDSGSIFLNGKDITSLAAAKRKVGMVFQDHALFPHLTVQDNVGYGLVSHGENKKQSRIIANELLERFDLKGFGLRWIDTLSGGEKQRVALARTLAVKPDLILFDEPLSSLDAPLRRRLREELRQFQKQFGFTAILVTHDIDEAKTICDTALVMKNGKTVWQGDAQEISEDLL